MGPDSALYLLFLGVIVVLHSVLPQRARVWALLAGSLMFYAVSGALEYLILLLALCAINYYAAARLGSTSNQSRRNWIFALTIAGNLAVLILFKYVRGPLTDLAAHIGWFAPTTAGRQIAMPLGLSYFTFQMIACVTDAYRQTWKLKGGLPQFTLFGLFFPQITSGPIPRAGGLMPQLADGGWPTAADRLAGLRLIAYGFFKKYVVAGRLSMYVADIFDHPPAGNSLPVLIACVFNALQLYADFSGYVDIAIGSARMIGIRLDPNFDRPLSSTSVTEFWRRWHITLAAWLRDYLYTPLVIRIRNFGKTGVVVAMLVTFAVCGIWHSATWTFLLFGVAQGVALSVEFLTKPWRTKRFKTTPKLLVRRLGNIYTLAFFTFSQVLFRSANLEQAGTVFSRLLQPRLSGGLNALLGVGPYAFAWDCLAITAWILVAWAYSRTTDTSTPWFLVLCVTLVLLVGSLGSARFIYAAF